MQPALERQDDACHHTDREADQKGFAPKLHHLQVFRLACAIPRGLHDREIQRQADRYRYEEEVVEGRQTELQPGEEQTVHRRHRRCFAELTAGCADDPNASRDSAVRHRIASVSSAPRPSETTVATGVVSPSSKGWSVPSRIRSAP